MYILRLFRNSGSRYIVNLHYIFETDAAVVFVIESMLTYSGLNQFIVYTKQGMYLKIFMMFNFLMFARELAMINMFYPNVDKDDFFF